MSKQDRDVRGDALATEIEKMRNAIASQDWRAAAKACDRLRFGYGWNYARMAQEFGGVERWEEIAQAIDDAESDRDEL